MTDQSKKTHKATLTESFAEAKDEKALLKKIAEHEAYSTAYKAKLLGIVATKAGKLAGKGALLAGKGLAVLGRQAGKGVKGLVKKASQAKEAKKQDW
jgi:hypothetical protein